jgi:anti-sigma regulatory factor (Ser/Thr protein kinase)
MFRLHATGSALALGGVGATVPPVSGGGRPSLGVKEFRELWLRQDARELRRARWLADTAAAEHGLDQDAQFRFTFAVNEAVANAIEHGAASPEGHILVRTTTAGEALCFEVHDWGSFTPSLSEADPMPERGRGLALMASMVDEVEVKPSGEATVVRLVMNAGAQAA